MGKCWQSSLKVMTDSLNYHERTEDPVCDDLKSWNEEILKQKYAHLQKKKTTRTEQI